MFVSTENGPNLNMQKLKRKLKFRNFFVIKFADHTCEVKVVLLNGK